MRRRKKNMYLKKFRYYTNRWINLIYIVKTTHCLIKYLYQNLYFILELFDAADERQRNNIPVGN